MLKNARLDTSLTLCPSVTARTARQQDAQKGRDSKAAADGSTGGVASGLR